MKLHAQQTSKRQATFRVQLSAFVAFGSVPAFRLSRRGHQQIVQYAYQRVVVASELRLSLSSPKLPRPAPEARRRHSDWMRMPPPLVREAPMERTAPYVAAGLLLQAARLLRKMDDH